MLRKMIFASFVGLISLGVYADEGKNKTGSDALQFTVKSIDGNDINLSKYQGKVMLVVNVASQCGYTPQYEGLQQLHKKYSEKGLAVLGFPANEFGKQEPGTNGEIKQFCTKNYGVEFDMFAKVVVKGKDQNEFFKFLTGNAKPAGDIKWNFEKFLIGRDGKIVGRFRSNVAPDSDELVKAIEAELAKK